MQEKKAISSSAPVSNLKKEPQAVSGLGLPLVLPQTLSFYAERLGVLGDGAAAQSWPKRTKSFQQIAMSGIDPRQNGSGLWKPKGDARRQAPATEPEF